MSQYYEVLQQMHLQWRSFFCYYLLIDELLSLIEYFNLLHFLKI